MRYLKNLVEVLIIVCCMVLSSCGGATKNTAATTKGGMLGGSDYNMPSGSAGKRMDEIMSACTRSGINVSDDDVAIAFYKCPSSAVPNIIKKIKKDDCYIQNSASTQCSDITKQGANTSVLYGVEEDTETVVIDDCTNNKYYMCDAKKGVL